MSALPISIDKDGDLKIGTRKCRTLKKAKIVRTAKNHGLPTGDKTIKQLCRSIKKKAKDNINQVGKMTRMTIDSVMPLPMNMTREEARQRISAMKDLSRGNMIILNRLNQEGESPRNLVRVARELARLR
jgi:tRNA A37 threonylcarbamoyladenosine synthetase subunit TsaC/SUA5/YrdC